ncbi:hypothetical protein S83_049349 [Arachis hypogaea]
MITTVNLTRQNLTGTISGAFGKLTHLENLYLSGNNLKGSIPENLTTLHQLKNLDVSHNNLSGKIPHFSRGVYLNTEGNPLFKRNPPAWIKGTLMIYLHCASVYVCMFSLFASIYESVSVCVYMNLQCSISFIVVGLSFMDKSRCL